MLKNDLGKSWSLILLGIISSSQEFSGIFYVLWRKKVLNFAIFLMFFFWFKSSFTVKKDSIHAENHWNSSINYIFLKIGFPDRFRKILVPGYERPFGKLTALLCIICPTWCCQKREKITSSKNLKFVLLTHEPMKKDCWDQY